MYDALRHPSARFVVPLALVMVVAAGAWWWLAADEDEAAPTDWSAVPVVQPELAPTPEPLPAADVWALAQLDVCGLATLDPRAREHQYWGTALECDVEGRWGEVEVSVRFSQPVYLLDLERRDLAGYAGWVGRRRGECLVVLPVREQAVLTFTSEGGAPGCEALARHARRVLERWERDPRAWTGADVLPHACQLAKAAGLFVGEAHFLNCAAGAGRQVIVDIDHSDIFEEVDEPSTVAGQPVVQSTSFGEYYDVHARCSIRWATGTKVDRERYWSDVAPGPTEEADVIVAATAPDCRTARRMAAKLIPAARSWTPPAPPRPMFYRFDEIDHTGVGACRDLLDQATRQCAVAVERRVPEDPVDFLRHGEADPDVVCTVALDLVRRYEPEFAAVSALPEYAGAGEPRGCVLVRPDDDTIEIRASREPVSFTVDAEIGGHAAYHPGPGTWEVALDDPDERGSLAVDLSHLADYGWFDDFVEELVRAVL